jgi:hypothetical protein
MQRSSRFAEILQFYKNQYILIWILSENIIYFVYNALLLCFSVLWTAMHLSYGIYTVSKIGTFCVKICAELYRASCDEASAE